MTERVETLEKQKKKISGTAVFNIIVFTLCGAMVVYFTISPGGFIDLVKSDIKINLTWLFAAIGCHLFNILCDTYLTYKFLSASVGKITLWQAFTVSMTGQFFCAVTPGASGGQPMQLLLMTRYNIDVGKGGSALMQKFLVWQFTLTGYSLIVILLRFSFFAEHLSPTLWTLGAIGFVAQSAMVFVLLLVSFSKKITFKIIDFCCRFLGKIHILKNPDKTIKSAEQQLEYFHQGNKNLYKNKKLLVETYVVTIIQMTAIFVVPYCVYRSFGLKGAGVVDMVCAQSFVNMVSSLVPMPGASGAAELGFAGFFGSFFDESTMKSAILVWRTITYYGTIVVSAPFSRLAKKSSQGEKTDEKISKA